VWTVIRLLLTDELVVRLPPQARSSTSAEAVPGAVRPIPCADKWTLPAPAPENSIGGLRQDGRTRVLGLLMTPSALFWSQKPWWCQPWSIISTGLIVSASSWVMLQRWWITAPVVAGVLVWWWLFLVLVPTATAADQQLRTIAAEADRSQASGAVPDPSASTSADLDP
jgi:hypothetical protein